MITLRDYQTTLLDDTRAALKQHDRVIMYLPTGGGKSQIMAAMAKSAYERGKTVWLTAHRDYLITQLSQTLAAHKVPHSFIAAGRHTNRLMRVFVCSIDTLRNRMTDHPAPDLLIPDEAHHSVSATWRKVIEYASKAKVVGPSASPARLDGRGLGEVYQAIVRGPSPRQLMDLGHLSEFRPFCPTVVDLTGVHIRAGDYVQAELEAALRKNASRIGDIVGHYHRNAYGRKAVYFAASVQDSKDIAAKFCALGMPFRHLDGATSADERANICKDLAAGRIMGITNHSIVSEGFDIEALTGVRCSIEVVGLCRPTKSLTLYLQAVGRGLRPKPEPAIIFDHANCIQTFGYPDDDREWTLEGQKRTAKSLERVTPIRICPECFYANRGAAVKCEDCPHVFRAEARKVDEVAGELVELSRAEMRARKEEAAAEFKRERQKARTIPDLIAFARRRGMANPAAYAAMVVTAREAAARKRTEHQVEFYLGR